MLRFYQIKEGNYGKKCLDPQEGTVTPAIFVPQKILILKPSSFFTKDILSPNGTGSIHFLAVILTDQDKTYLIGVRDLHESFIYKREKMNVSTGVIETSFHLSAAVRDWQNREICRFVQYNGLMAEMEQPYQVLGERGFMDSGTINLATGWDTSGWMLLNF